MNMTLEKKPPNPNNRENRWGKKEKKDSLRDMWDYNTRCNDDINMSSESQEKKEGGAAEVFKEIMAENAPNLAKVCKPTGSRS